MGKIWLSSMFEVEDCVACGVTFAMTTDYANKKKKDHRTFYCPNGHRQHYAEQSDEEKLKDALKHCKLDRDFWLESHGKEQEKRKAVERSRGSYKGQITKLKGQEVKEGDNTV